jgi:hypothetical protein
LENCLFDSLRNDVLEINHALFDERLDRREAYEVVMEAKMIHVSDDLPQVHQLEWWEHLSHLRDISLSDTNPLDEMRGDCEEEEEEGHGHHSPRMDHIGRSKVCRKKSEETFLSISGKSGQGSREWDHRERGFLRWDGSWMRLTK